MAKFVKTLVGRPMQVPIVNGLKRYLRSASNVVLPQNPWKSYAAPIAMLSHFLSFLEEVNSRVEEDWPESAICIRAFAERRSSRMYKRLVKRENADEGMSANNGSSKGAYMGLLAY